MASTISTRSPGSFSREGYLETSIWVLGILIASGVLPSQWTEIRYIYVCSYKHTHIPICVNTYMYMNTHWTLYLRLGVYFYLSLHLFGNSQGVISIPPISNQYHGVHPSFLFPYFVAHFSGSEQPESHWPYHVCLINPSVHVPSPHGSHPHMDAPLPIGILVPWGWTTGALLHRAEPLPCWNADTPHRQLFYADVPIFFFSFFTPLWATVAASLYPLLCLT